MRSAGQTPVCFQMVMYARDLVVVLCSSHVACSTTSHAAACGHQACKELCRGDRDIACVAQEVLHVHVPHYCHMFEAVMAGPRPWRFGHVYLPGGSANLGNPCALAHSPVETGLRPGFAVICLCRESLGLWSRLGPGFIGQIEVEGYEV